MKDYLFLLPYNMFQRSDKIIRGTLCFQLVVLILIPDAKSLTHKRGKG